MTDNEKKIRWTDRRFAWERPSTRHQRITDIVLCLKQNARMSLSEISRRTGIPVSSVFDYMKVIEEHFWFTAVPLNTGNAVRRTVLLETTVQKERKRLEVGV